MATTRALTSEEIVLITRSLADRKKQRDVVLVLAGAGTGFRAAELLTLQWGQLVATDGQIAREVTVDRRLLKGGRGGRARAIRSRRVALGERVREAVADYLATLGCVPTPDTYVFRSRKGQGPITRTQALHILKEAARAAGIPNERVGMHSLRRTFAKGVYEHSGRCLITAQRLLGHSSPITSAKYLRDASQDDLDKVVLSFDPLAPSPTAGSVASPNLYRLLAQ